MDGLEMPAIDSGGCVQRDDRVAEKVRSCTIDADEVGRRGAHRQEDETPRRIGCDRRPDVCSAGRLPGTGRPRLRATLAVTWNRIKAPDEPAAPRIIRTYRAGRLDAPYFVADRRADDHDVADDRRR